MSLVRLTGSDMTFISLNFALSAIFYPPPESGVGLALQLVLPHCHTRVLLRRLRWACRRAPSRRRC